MVRPSNKSDLPYLVGFDDIAATNDARKIEIRNGIEQGRCWVAENIGTPVGYALLKSDFFGFDFIQLVYVHSTFRRRGIGTALIRCLEKQCRTPKLFTSTNESNVAMQRVLESLGYRRSGLVENLDLDDPELIFVKDLKDKASS